MAKDKDSSNRVEEETAASASEEDRGRLGDALKKVVFAGIGAAFMTEEHIRNYVSDLKLPKEVINLLLQNAQKSKQEIVNRISAEAIGIMNRIDFVKEASRFAEEHKFKVTAEIEVMRKPKTQAKEEQPSED